MTTGVVDGVKEQQEKSKAAVTARTTRLLPLATIVGVTRGRRVEEEVKEGWIGGWLADRWRKTRGQQSKVGNEE